MFNRNGSNNGNGVHQDTALATRNGNGHKPDAAIVTEHDLLWDGLSARRHAGARPAPRPQPGLPAQGARRQGLRLPRRPRRHRAGQHHLRIRRVGLRAGRGRDAAPDRDGRYPDGRGHGLPGLQRPGPGHRLRRSAPHRPRRPPGGRGHPRRTRHGDERGRNGRHEAGVPQLRRPVRQRLLRRPGPGERTAPRSAFQPRACPGPGPGPTAGPANPRPAAATTAASRTMRKRLVELAAAQGFDEDQLGAAVVNQTGKSIEDLTADELGFPGRGRRQQAEPDAAGAGRLAPRSFGGSESSGVRLLRGTARSFIYRKGGTT